MAGSGKEREREREMKVQVQIQVSVPVRQSREEISTSCTKNTRAVTNIRKQLATRWGGGRWGRWDVEIDSLLVLFNCSPKTDQNGGPLP